MVCLVSLTDSVNGLPPIIISADWDGDISELSKYFMETYSPFPLHCMKVRGGTQVRCTTRQDLINLESILL